MNSKAREMVHFENDRSLALTTSISKIFFVLWIFSGFQTTGLSFHGDPPMRMPSTTASPYLEPIKYNTTVFLGQTVYLPCVVKHLGSDKTVSWIRKRDLHILTSGNQVYTSDPRVSLLREGKLLNAWTLKISSIQKKDEGAYECQVNTEPKMTATLYLIVLGSIENDKTGAVALGMLDSPYHQRDDHRSKGYEAKILGPSIVELELGKLANITCIISYSGPPPNVSWFLNDIPIQKSSSTRGGFNIETEKSPFFTISQLVIVKVDKLDEGKYSCGGMTVYPYSVILKVLPYHSSRAQWKEVSASSSCSISGPSRRPHSYFWLISRLAMLILPFLFVIVSVQYVNLSHFFLFAS